MNLAEMCYRLARELPSDELYGLSSQIRRAAVSIPANIAEGYGRGFRREYLQFLSIAQGSLKELETHLLLCQRLGLCPLEPAEAVLQQADQLGRMLGGLRRALQQESGA
jgi:four helix bundle protein